MSDRKLSGADLKRLANDYYAADGVFGAFNSAFVQAYGRMGLEVSALQVTQDVPPVFLIAPGVFDGDEDNDSGDCQQYNTPHSRLRAISNEPIGYIQFEIQYMIDVPQPTKKFWMRCSHSNNIMPDIKLLGAYER